MTRNPSFILLLLLCIGLIWLYCTNLNFSPPPFFFDEYLVSAVIAKVSILNEPLQTIFRHENLRDNYSYLPYVLAGVLTTKVLGFSIYSIRLTSAVLALTTAVFVFIASRLYNTPVKYSLIASIIYLLLPPVVVQSRIAWDPAIYPFFTTLSILLFQLLYRRTTSATSAKSLSNYLVSAATGTALGFSSWSYPPGQVVSVLILLFFLLKACLFKSLPRNNYKYYAPVILISGLMYAHYFFSRWSLTGGANRYTQESVLGQSDIIGKILYALYKNLLDFDYVLLVGDLNYRHSLAGLGILLLPVIFLGILLSIIFVSGLRNEQIDKYVKPKRELKPVVLKLSEFAILILILTLPAALGNTTPHSLRASASFPVWAILSGYCLYITISKFIFMRMHMRHVILYLSIGMIIFTYINTSRLLLGGKSFLNASQFSEKHRLPASSYPFLAREAFNHAQFLNLYNEPDSAICAKITEPNAISDKLLIDLDQLESAVIKSRLTVTAAERQLSCLNMSK